MDKLGSTSNIEVSSNFSIASNLAVAWLETRTPMEMQYYSQLNSITHKIIAEGFSSKVITPGITTTDDMVWWFRQKVNDLGLDTWFHPTVDVQRSGKSDLYAFDGMSKYDIIYPGDLLHCDFGITYISLKERTKILISSIRFVKKNHQTV